MQNQTIQSRGWVIVITSGLIKSEVAKLRRKLVNLGAHKLGGGIYAVPCIRGAAGTAELVEKLRSLGTIETSFQVTYITKKQWSDSYLVHGKPSTSEA